jgi:hypothetical protein
LYLSIYHWILCFESSLVKLNGAKGTHIFKLFATTFNHLWKYLGTNIDITFRCVFSNFFSRNHVQIEVKLWATLRTYFSHADKKIAIPMFYIINLCIFNIRYSSKMWAHDARALFMDPRQYITWDLIRIMHRSISINNKIKNNI